jgi:hypothetical protein
MPTLQPLRENIQQLLDHYMISHGWHNFRKNGYSIDVANGVVGVIDFVDALWPGLNYVSLRVWFGLIFDSVERQVVHLQGRRYRRYQTCTVLTHLDFYDPVRKNKGWTFYAGGDLTSEYDNLTAAIENIVLGFMRSHTSLESLCHLFTIPPDVFWHIGYEGDCRAPVILHMLSRSDEALAYMEHRIEYARAHRDPYMPNVPMRGLQDYEAYANKVREMIRQDKERTGH